MLKCQWQYDIPLGTRRYYNAELTSLALIQRRNNVVCRWGCPQEYFQGANSTKGFTSPEQNQTSPHHLLLCICKENPLALKVFHQPRVIGLVRFCIPDFISLHKGI